MRTILCIIILCFLLAIPQHGNAQLSPQLTSKTLVVDYDKAGNKIVCSFKKKTTLITLFNQEGKEQWEVYLKDKHRRAFGYMIIEEDHFVFLTFNAEVKDVMMHKVSLDGKILEEQIVEVKGLHYIYFTQAHDQVLFTDNWIGEPGKKSMNFSLFDMRTQRVQHDSYLFFNAEITEVTRIIVSGNRIFFTEKSDNDLFTLSEYNIEKKALNRFDEKRNGSEGPYELLDDFSWTSPEYAYFICGQIPGNMDLIFYNVAMDKVSVINIELEHIQYPGSFTIRRQEDRLFIAGLGYSHDRDCVRPIGHFILSMSLPVLGDLQQVEKLYPLYKEIEKTTTLSNNRGEFREFDEGLTRSMTPRQRNKATLECYNVPMKSIYRLDLVEDEVQLVVADLQKTLFEVVTIYDDGRRKTSYVTQYIEHGIHNHTYNRTLSEELNYEYEEIPTDDRKVGLVKNLNPYNR